MSGKGHSPRPYDSEAFGRNYDRIFRRSDPAHSLVPGTIREYRSDCCGSTVTYAATHGVCDGCGKPCIGILTKINP